MFLRVSSRGGISTEKDGNETIIATKRKYTLITSKLENFPTPQLQNSNPHHTPVHERKPPSTGTVIPVTKPAASSSISQFIHPTSSRASPKCFMGV